MKLTSFARMTCLFFIALTALTATGCSHNKAADTGPVFFPPPPNAPRVQYLTSFGSSSDVEDKKNGLAFVLIGDTPDRKEKPISKPYGIVARGTELYLCDTGAGKIIHVDLAAKKFEYLKGDQGAGKLKKPVALTLDPAGNLFVADTMRKDVAMYDSSGNYVKSYAHGVTVNPVAVSADESSLYVLDNRANLVKAIDRKSDSVIREFGQGQHEDSIALPVGMTMDNKGFLHITNLLSGRVLSFDHDGHLIRGFGKLGDTFGEFGRPRGIAVDNDGMVYVADASHQNVQIFNDKGRILMFFGDPGLPVGSMNLPAGVSVTTSGLDFFRKFADPSFELEKIIYVTNQSGKDKVAVYGLGHKKDAAPEPAVPATAPASPAAAPATLPAASQAATAH